MSINFGDFFTFYIFVSQEIESMNFTEIKKHVGRYKVGIAGCGGLGSNCAVALARIGIGELVLVDFDVVESSNLNRQYYFFNQVGRKKVHALRENIRNIDPGVKIEVHDTTITSKNVAELFRDCDVIVEAFDRAEMKHMLVEEIISTFSQKYIVTAVGLAGWGKSNDIRVRYSDNLVICGDELDEVTEELPPLAPRVGIVANIQANEVLYILLEKLK
jgi:sulfur carrier protein ThiS adenylyltransferase